VGRIGVVIAAAAPVFFTLLDLGLDSCCLLVWVGPTLRDVFEQKTFKAAFAMLLVFLLDALFLLPLLASSLLAVFSTSLLWTCRCEGFSSTGFLSTNAMAFSRDCFKEWFFS